MSKYYSRRELYALGEPLGESSTQIKVGGGRIYGGGGGGGGGGQAGADGGGGGGGGGGYWGGAGGATYGGDDGAYSGENGTSAFPSGFTETAGTNSPGEVGSVVVSYTSDVQLFLGGTVTNSGTAWTHTFGPGQNFLISNLPSSYKPIREGWTKLNGEWKQFFPSSGQVTFNTDGTLTLGTPTISPTKVIPAEAALIANGSLDIHSTPSIAYDTLVTLANNPFFLSQVEPYPVTAKQVFDGEFTLYDQFGSVVTYSASEDRLAKFLSIAFNPTYNGENKLVESSFLFSLQAAQSVDAHNRNINSTSPNTFTWTVPPGIHSITVDMVGGGGGGGGGEEVGVGSAGGGGGSGGYYQNQIMPVVPGEVLTIRVGQGGAGAPFVGRTTGAPGGQPGGTSLVSGEESTLTATGGGGGAGGSSSEGGGGGGGCKIICTKLHEFGYLSDEIYEADERFGQYLRDNDPYAYYGYVKWASVVVDWMERDGPQCMFWIRDKEQRNQAQRNMAINWARRIATPWAEHMAYIMGVGEKDNRAGRLIMKTGMWVSRMIGKYTKTTEPSKSVALGYVMWATFGVFWLLAGVK